MFTLKTLEELKNICRAEGRDLSDNEATLVGQNVIRYLLNAEAFKETAENPREAPKLTEEEHRAYLHIKATLEASGAPTARTVAQALGFSSARTGHRMILRLAEKGVIRYRRNKRAE